MILEKISSVLPSDGYIVVVGGFDTPLQMVEAEAIYIADVQNAMASVGITKGYLINVKDFPKTAEQLGVGVVPALLTLSSSIVTNAMIGSASEIQLAAWLRTGISPV